MADIPDYFLATLHPTSMHLATFLHFALHASLTINQRQTAQMLCTFVCLLKQVHNDAQYPVAHCAFAHCSEV